MHSVDNGRYKSWEHCFNAFLNYKRKTLYESDIDYLCLHLAFYLASWGMYRGSSFLLQRDYRVHIKAVKELLESKYDKLWSISCEDLASDKQCLNDLFSLAWSLKDIYSEIRRDVNISLNKKDPAQAVSDVLVTKILMGTLGCVPAYDRYFKNGIKAYGVSTMQFNHNGIRRLCEYYIANSQPFEHWRCSISDSNITYPQMKVLDMVFWQKGYDLDLNKEKSSYMVDI